MSKEFEEIVLKKLEKLDALDERTQNTDRVIGEVILKKLDTLETEVGSLKAEVKDTNQRLGNLEIEVKDTNQRLGNLEIEVKDINKRLGNLEIEVKDINKRLGNLEIEVKDTQEVVNYLNQSFTRFDYEINKKIDTLFDSDTVNKENLVSLNTKTFNHDTRISNLENKDLKLIKF